LKKKAPKKMGVEGYDQRKKGGEYGGRLDEIQTLGSETFEVKKWEKGRNCGYGNNSRIS